jgi:hypothetical protein
MTAALAVLGMACRVSLGDRVLGQADALPLAAGWPRAEGREIRCFYALGKEASRTTRAALSIRHAVARRTL